MFLSNLLLIKHQNSRWFNTLSLTFKTANKHFCKNAPKYFDFRKPESFKKILNFWNSEKANLIRKLVLVIVTLLNIYQYLIAFITDIMKESFLTEIKQLWKKRRKMSGFTRCEPAGSTKAMERFYWVRKNVTNVGSRFL